MSDQRNDNKYESKNAAATESACNKAEFQQKNNSDESVEPLPESTRPRKDGPGGD